MDTMETTQLQQVPAALDNGAPTTAPKFSPGLPIELWSEVVAIVARPITQFVASPSAARRACLQDTYDARDDLLSLAHVCKMTYAAARPYLYGTLVLCLRPSPLHDARIIPEVERVNNGASETAWDVAKTVNHNYLAQREQLSIMSQMFPGSCVLLDDDEDPCSSSHMDRDAKIAQVTEVPEVFPLVVLGGKLYLASLLSRETGTNDSQQSDLDELASVIRTSAESLLVDRGGAEGPSTACLDVKIVNGLVLVSYPLHLVTALDLRTTAIDVGLWLAIPNPNKDYGPIYDWAHKLPFLFDIAPHQLESLVLATWSDSHHAFSDLCEQLFRAFPHVAKLDVLLPNILRYNYPGWFPAHLQSASLFQTGRPWDGNVLPRAFSRNPSRHLEIYGEHPCRCEDWENLFNHPTLESLVTDFMIPSFRLGALSFFAPRLKSWTTNTLVANVLFDFETSKPNDASLDERAMFPALEELTILELHSGPEGHYGYPDDNRQVPELPYKHIGKHSLRRFVMAPKYSDNYLWINVCSDVLVDLLSLPYLESLHLPTVVPFFDSPFAPQLTCTNLSTLEINLELFLSILANVSFPCLTSLTLVGDYMLDEDKPRFSPAVWLQIASAPLGRQLAHFASRQIPVTVELSHLFVFPANSPVLERLESIDLFTSTGHVDVTHLPAIAPNLRSAKLDVDHLTGIPLLLAHPRLVSLTIACLQCPTLLEQLLAHDFALDFAFTFKKRGHVAHVGRKSSVVGKEDCGVCERKDMTLVLDRQRNTKVWRKLAAQPLDAMVRGQVDTVTLVVPIDVADLECWWILCALKKVMANWEGIKVKLLVSVDGADAGSASVTETGQLEAMPAQIERFAERGLKKMASGKIVGEVEWMGVTQGSRCLQVVGKCCLDA